MLYAATRRMYIHLLAMSAVGYFFVKFIMRDEYERRGVDDRTLVRNMTRMDVLDSIIRESDNNCIWELRMSRNAFARLCELLIVRGGLTGDGRVTVEEQVAIFVNILAHHTKNRTIRVRFKRSGETISRYCHHVLHAVVRLHDVLLAKPEPVPQDCTDERWKWFKVSYIPLIS